MSVFATLLRLCRNAEQLTQREFTEYLSLSVPAFEKLNTVTLSRWENGISSANQKRKKALLHYIFEHGCLNHPECLAYIKERIVSVREPLQKILDRNYLDIISAFPPFKVKASEYHFEKIAHYSDQQLNYLLEIERSSHPDDYYMLDIARLREWCNHESTFALGCELYSEHLGHIILLKVSMETAEQIIYNRRSVFTLTPEDLLSTQEQGVYLMHTFFAVNAEIMAYLSLKTFTFLLDRWQYISHIALFLTRRHGVQLMKLYGNRILSKGRDPHSGYRWYGACTPLQEILFSDLVTKLFFDETH